MDPCNSKLSVCLIAQLVDHCTLSQRSRFKSGSGLNFSSLSVATAQVALITGGLFPLKIETLFFISFMTLSNENRLLGNWWLDQLKILGLPQFSLMWSKLKWLFEIRIIKVVMTMESWWYEGHSCGILACSSVLLRFVILTTLTRKNAQHKMKPPKIFEKGFFFLLRN